MSEKSNIIISIEGNIGSGKSTLLAELIKKYSSNNPKNIVFLKEPVDDWETIKDINGLTMLQKFYSNQEKYSFPFQMMAYISRLALLKKTIKENKQSIIITERSLLTDRHIFAKMLYDNGKIEDVNYQIYLKWFDTFSSDFPIKKIIYVKTTPEICYKRILQRSRLGEDIIPLDYLNSCNHYHDSMMSLYEDTDVLLIDGNMDIHSDPQLVESWLDRIDEII
jgi:deoxyadenosine/deoxycytidine kinase